MLVEGRGKCRWSGDEIGSDVRFPRGWALALDGSEVVRGEPINQSILIFCFFFTRFFFLFQPRLRPTGTNTMAGDHKCPVCQATFTRPQHVARHMRSRTSSTILTFPTLLTNSPYTTPTRSSPPHTRTSSPISPPHRYRRSPIQVSALWRSVRQKVRLSTLIPFFSPAATLHS